jgi:chromatin structure-remodeling complex subunit RSC1/2
MILTPVQKSAVEEIINVLVTTTGPRGKRRLAEMFMNLVDKDEWPEYYEVFVF